MRALRIQAGQATAAEVEGRVLTHDLGPRLRKGRILGAGDLEALRGAAGEIHVVELEPGDVHEDAAAARLAAAIAGEGVVVEGPHQSQMRLAAGRRGLLRVAADSVDRLNGLGTVSVFTLPDGQAVNQGEEVAGTKVTPVAVPSRLLEEAERLSAASGPVVTVLPFKPLRTLVVATERLKPKARDLFRQAVVAKLGWYGAELIGVVEVARAPEAVRSAYRRALESGAELVLFAGASAIDPLDAAYSELNASGGELLRVGAPMHPGSMLWLGRLGGAAVLGVASCAGFGRNTSLDLVLPFVFAYGHADAEHMNRLGHGGLIESAAGRRFPPYS